MPAAVAQIPIPTGLGEHNLEIPALDAIWATDTFGLASFSALEPDPILQDFLTRNTTQISSSYRRQCPARGLLGWMRPVAVERELDLTLRSMR
jgi:hypothetical protein